MSIVQEQCNFLSQARRETSNLNYQNNEKLLMVVICKYIELQKPVSCPFLMRRLRGMQNLYRANKLSNRYYLLTMNLSSPTGGLAYGMPIKALMPLPFTVVRYLPTTPPPWFNFTFNDSEVRQLE